MLVIKRMTIRRLQIATKNGAAILAHCYIFAKVLVFI